MKANPAFEAPRHDWPPSLSPHQFTRLVLAGKIVDGRPGGLIFGRSFDDGGIMALYKLGSSYVVKGKVEGGEFAVNWQAGTLNLARLQSMNAGVSGRERHDPNEVEPMPGASQLILTNAWPDDRLVFLHWGQVLVNKEATIRHVAELMEMNKSPNPYMECDLGRIFGLDGTADGVI